ncbi:PucR family transcriptional regulator [Cryptosporangium aurantiacum]|uniref:PucR C-terminal helix-turn-helix domain-containing protein n=1 Tax=Cryptosporangium aurantiacum TaxID=134849 RepID=A0A1M7TU20_9ACTN|nr:helix-turn-helix domain-containing protein [Cryptosporangium aurantiacum]SHN74234.1 PucR C-terminal helix-turn-helix domain-containing protein [Cryptosporangium aurantiacum]
MSAAPVGPSVHALAALLRAHRLPALTGEVFRHVVELRPEYLASGALSATDLRDTCRVSLGQMLGELADGGAGGRLSLEETGRRRAQEGAPMEWLLHGYRLCARAIWQALVSEATRSGDDGVRRLLAEAVVVWDALDRVSTVVAAAYREEQTRLQRTTRLRRETVLSGLLERRPPTPSAVAEASDVLGIPARGPRLVVTATACTPSDDGRNPEAALRAAGFPSVWVTHGARESGLVALDHPDDVEGAVAALVDCVPGQASVSPVIDGFDDVATAHRLTVLTLRTLPTGHRGVVLVTDRLPHALVAAAPDVAEVLVRHTLGGLSALRPSEWDAYVETLEALVECDGSVSAAARRLGCHRNTVQKRLHRIEALTGRRLTSLRAMVELSLALPAVRLDATSSAAPGRPPG